MIGLNFIKVDPSTYLIKYQGGKISKEGAGISFFYYAPSTSLVSVPIGSEEALFVFNELTKDFQEVTIQGQTTYKIVDVHSLTQMLNYTLNSQGEYISEDPKKLPKRIINLAQVLIRRELSQLNLKDAMPSAEKIANIIKTELANTDALKQLGIEIVEFSITAIKPNKETARALEAETREILLRQADEAVYLRRNAAIEQERIIKENELKTEVVAEQKRREIVENRLETQKAEQERRQKMREADMDGSIKLQKQNEELVNLTVQNTKKEADAKAYGINACLEAMNKADPKLIQILAMNGMNPAQIIASSFQSLAENADKIGQLNISPELLNQLIQTKNA